MTPRRALGLLCLAPLALAAAPPAGEGLLGLRYQPLDDGLLVTSITDGMGAAVAGLTPGALLLEADGAPLDPGAADLRARLVGPPGSTVRLTVSGPLDAGRRELVLTRMEAPPTVLSDRVERPPVVQAFREAARGGRKRAAVAAARAMVEADFGGMDPSEAVGAALSVAHRRDPRLARAVAEVLAPAAHDPALISRVAEVLLQTGGAEAVVPLLERRAALSPPDLRLAGGGEGDLGGARGERHMRVDALWALGRRDEATQVARDLLRTWPSDRVAATVGLALAPDPAPWRAAVPPVPAFQSPLVDGGSWDLDAHRGEVVLINFWATWCGPCKEELPELAKLAEARAGKGLSVVAVSVDQGDVEPVARMARKLDLPFAVAHDPGLGARFGVTGIPALRVLGRDGALQYSARGYSPEGVERLAAAVDRALAEGEAGGPVAWPGGPRPDAGALRRHHARSGATAAVAVGDGRIALGVLGASPEVFSADGAPVAEADQTGRSAPPAGRLAWAGGPVGVDLGGHLVTAWDADGAPRWWRGVPGRITDLIAAGDRLFVATDAGLHVLGADGGVLATLPGLRPVDLAASPDGRVWALERGRLHAIDPAAPAAGAGEPVHPGVARVTEGGDLLGLEAVSAVSGRFGPDGAPRVVAARADGTLVAVDSAGAPVFTLRLRARAGLAAADLDGDGQDELLAALEDHGLMVIDLRLP
jgi:thiol-disulfide isomerase/thioredoxin